jgi:hypothetical protein
MTVFGASRSRRMTSAEQVPLARAGVVEQPSKADFLSAVSALSTGEPCLHEFVRIALPPTPPHARRLPEHPLSRIIGLRATLST